MCGCSANFDGQDDFDFTGNRPSLIEVGEDPSFDFTGNRPSVIEVGEDPSFDFMSDIESNNEFQNLIGKKAKARRQERRAIKQGQDTTQTTQTTRTTEDEGTDGSRATYGGGWFGRNWHLLLIGAVVVGGGYYIYKRRK
jgi:hypothetical protein